MPGGLADRSPSKECGMQQQGQVFELKTRSHGGEAVWAYRYRIAGRDSRRLQRGGFKSERAAREALERALARLRREQGLVEAPRLRELVDLYLAQHGGEPETVAKLRWLFTKAVRALRTPADQPASPRRDRDLAHEHQRRTSLR